MAYVGHETVKGIARTDSGYIVAEVVIAEDDSAFGPRETIRRRLLDGPFTGTGAKRRAIQAAGTNRVVPA